MIARLSALLLALAQPAAAVAAQESTPAALPRAAEIRIHGPYRNEQYGFAMAVPAGTAAWSTAAPAPNHGVRLDLGPGRTISVFGEFDAAEAGSAKAVLDAALSDYAARHVRYSGTRLGGRAAWRADFFHDGTPAAIVTQQVGPADARINLVVELATDRVHRRRDLATFVAVLRTVRHIPRA